MTASILKIIAMVTMLIDHIGVFLLPDVAILRIIGRLAFPIFAFYIAEGCIYTKNYKKYLLRLFLCALTFQVIDCVFRPGCNPCVVWAYIAAVAFVMLYKWAKQNWNKRGLITVIYAFMVSILLLVFKVDYYFFGFLFIISAYLMHKHRIKWILMALSLFALGFFYQYQFFALLALPILMLYNGKKDKWNLGRITYYFYPAHYLILGVLQYVIQ